MDDIRIRQGATLERTFTDTDITAQTLTLTISKDGAAVDTVTSNYSQIDGRAIATVSTVVDYPLGDYDYMYTIVYGDGFILKVPEPNDCGDEPCALPVLTVCEANDEVES